MPVSELIIAKFVMQKLYNCISLSNLIDEMYENIIHIYNNISLAFKKTAAQALKAANSSSNPHDEIMCAINEYRNAYNVLKILLDEKKVTHFFLKKYEEYLIPDYNRPKFNLELSKLTYTISLLYRYIHEKRSADEWKKLSIEHYEESLVGFVLPMEDLRKINPHYVTSEGYTIADYDPIDNFVTTSTEYRDALTSLGEEYMSHIRKKMVNEFRLHFEDSVYELGAK